MSETPSPSELTIATSKKIADFFAAGGLTVYASAHAAWRWRICAGQVSLQATVIDPHSLFEQVSDQAPEVFPALPAAKHIKTKKPFERSTLVKWLTGVAQKTPGQHAITAAANSDPADHTAFAELIGMQANEWAALELSPPLLAAEIRHFEQAHNAALSDIESAFLPEKTELPPTLATFYIRYLTKARRDVEATFLIAQSSNSTRVPFRMADALAVGAFEGAANNPLRHEGNEYALSVANDTSSFIDAALAIATQRLQLAIDHPDHLLRLNVMDITRLASDIVAQHRLPPFRFLLKAKELFLARCDVCRFPPFERFSTALAEQDVNAHEGWVQRVALGYNRLFPGEVQINAAPAPAEVIKLSKRT